MKNTVHTQSFLFRSLTRSLIILIFTALLSACGFQLKQSASLPASFGPVSVEGLDRYSSIYRTLRNALKQSDIEISEDSTANHRLLVTASRERKVLAVTAAGKASEYELIQSLVYRVVTANGEDLIETRTLSSSAYYTTSTSEVLNDTKQETDIFQRLEQRLIDQMFNQISGLYR